MPRQREIGNKVTSDLYSMQVYSQPLDFGNLNQEFEKWAAVEVSDLSSIPDGMESFTIEGGLYAVFPYKGSSTDTTIFRLISEPGCQARPTPWIADPILKYWVINTRARTQIPKKRYGFQSNLKATLICRRCAALNIYFAASKNICASQPLNAQQEARCSAQRIYSAKEIPVRWTLRAQEKMAEIKESIEVKNLAELHDWLTKNESRSTGVWLIRRKQALRVVSTFHTPTW